MRRSAWGAALAALGWAAACGDSGSGTTANNFVAPTRMAYAPAPPPPPEDPEASPNPLVFVLNAGDGSLTAIDFDREAAIDADRKSSNPRTRILGEEGDQGVDVAAAPDGATVWLAVNRFPQSRNDPRNGEEDVTNEPPSARIYLVDATRRPLVTDDDRPADLPFWAVDHPIEHFLPLDGQPAALLFQIDPMGHRFLRRIDLETGEIRELGDGPGALWKLRLAPRAEASALVYAVAADQRRVTVLDCARLAEEGWDAGWLGEVPLPELPAAGDGDGDEENPVARIGDLRLMPDGVSGWASDPRAPRLYRLRAEDDLPVRFETVGFPGFSNPLGLALVPEGVPDLEGFEGPLAFVTTQANALYVLDADSGEALRPKDQPATVETPGFLADPDNPDSTRPALTVTLTDEEAVRDQSWAVLWDDGLDGADGQPAEPGLRVSGSLAGEMERWTDTTRPYDIPEQGLSMTISGNRGWMDGEGWTFTTLQREIFLGSSGFRSATLEVFGSKLFIANEGSNTVGILPLAPCAAGTEEIRMCYSEVVP